MLSRSSAPRRSSRRAAAAAGALVLPLAGLAACGSDDGSPDPSGVGLSGITVEGEAGTAPEVTWDEKVEPEELETEVLSEGDGPEVADGDNVLTHLWIGNAYTEKKAYSTYDQEKPELITVNDEVTPGIRAALEGHTVGSRVAVAAPPEDAFGEMGNPQLAIGNKDPVVFVVDLVETVAGEPSGEERTPAKWAPELVESDGTVTGFDFSVGQPPGGKLLDTTLVKGDGAVVEKGQTLYVNYLGQVYEGKEPFDESYSAGTPASFPIGVGQVVKGWDQTLVGKTVGSRVILEIPPALGYGKKGNEQAGIKGTDTLFFVVDILAAV